MDKLSGLVELLKEPLKIISRNGKLMAITAIIYLVLLSTSFILNIFSILPFTDLVLKLLNIASARPGTYTTHLLCLIREDTFIFLGIEVAYVIVYFFIMFFAQTTIVIIASRYYDGKYLCTKELISTVSKTWYRAFVTLSYVQLLALVYTSFFFLPVLIPTLLLYRHPAILIIVLIFLAILLIAFYIYLSVVWSLAVVVSVVEDSYGSSSLTKARELGNGRRLYGFLLNLFFILALLVVLIVGSKLSFLGIELSPLMPIFVGVIQTLLIGVLSMFNFITYTGYYFQCKNHMMKSGGLEYCKIPITEPLLDQDLP